jgi:hypothetical protein
MLAIWAWAVPHNNGRPQYDCEHGASFYGMGEYGGSFNLTDWLRATHPQLGCYDLAGIAQVACGLLLDGAGGEVVDSNWVFQQPNAYILPGTLYGRDDVVLLGGAPGLNNPFFNRYGEIPAKNKIQSLTSLPAPPAPAYVAPPSLLQRDPFANHTWIELTVDFGAHRTVIDATHAVQDAAGVINPEVGARNRNDYSLAHRDQQIELNPAHRPVGNLDNFISGPVLSFGNCCMSLLASLTFTSQV